MAWKSSACMLSSSCISRADDESSGEMVSVSIPYLDLAVSCQFGEVASEEWEINVLRWKFLCCFFITGLQIPNCN